MKNHADSRFPSLTSFCRKKNSISNPFLSNEVNRAYQSFHSPVKCMSVIPSELGVSSVEGRIAVSFGFLDSIERFPSSAADSLYASGSPSSEISCHRQGG